MKATREKLPLDALAVAIGTGALLLVVVIFQWRKILVLLGTVAALALVAAAVCLPSMWVLSKAFAWSAPRQTATQRAVWILAHIATALGLIAVILAGMAFFG